MSPSVISEDPHTIAERLAKACRAQGLSTAVLSPTRVKVSLPKSHHDLAEVIKIMPDETEYLALYWSWNERICAATEIETAVKSIKHVVTPPLHSQF
jgi:hypothetical protein